MPPRPIRVLFPTLRPTTNPYLVMIREALAEHPDVELMDLTWKAALLGDWDVLHLHWPEILLQGRTPHRRRAKQAALAALLTRVRLTRRAVVRTYHNVQERSDLTATQRRLLRRVDAQTSLWIVLNTVAVPDTAAPVHLIPHGHYRGWYARFPGSDQVPGRVGYFGLIRPYKAVDVLISAFREAAAIDPELSLAIAGKPVPVELADQLIGAVRLGSADRAAVRVPLGGGARRARDRFGTDRSDPPGDVQLRNRAGGALAGPARPDAADPAQRGAGCGDRPGLGAAVRRAPAPAGSAGRAGRTPVRRAPPTCRTGIGMCAGRPMSMRIERPCARCTGSWVRHLP